MDILKIIQEYMKCYKENCKDDFDNIDKDKKLQIIKNKLKKNKNLKEIDKIVFDIYSNKNQKDFELCVYKKCSIVKDFQEYIINSLNKKIKIFEIKFSNDIKIKYDNLIKLISKSSLTDEEYINFIILFYYFDRIIEIIVMEKLFNIFKHWDDYSKCKYKKCNKLYKDVNDDEELKKKRSLIFQYYNNDDERNKVIRDIYSNEKQVKLDKCMINNCNNILLNLLQNTLKHFNNIIKAYDVKIPKEIQLPEIKKITEKDIPEIMIKYYQIFNYSNKYD
jgi:hypothetical protein